MRNYHNRVKLLSQIGDHLIQDLDLVLGPALCLEGQIVNSLSSYFWKVKVFYIAILEHIYQLWNRLLLSHIPPKPLVKGDVYQDSDHIEDQVSQGVIQDYD